MNQTKKHNLHTLLKAIAIAAIGISLAGCGSVSEMENTAMFNAGKYTKVSVLDFENNASTKKVKADEIQAYNESVAIAGRLFADKIAAELRKRQLFSEVVRGETDGNALVIKGAVTRFAEGNAALRLMIGMGAGSSYFDAEVNFVDNEDGTQLALMKVDKNSWVLGGGLAAGQTVEGYMDNAAKKIAEELAKALAQESLPQTGN